MPNSGGARYTSRRGDEPRGLCKDFLVTGRVSCCRRKWKLTRGMKRRVQPDAATESHTTVVSSFSERRGRGGHTHQQGPGDPRG